ncbi:MAG: glycosyltransferase family 4 protein [Desulfitobacterium hafniense]|nr:glycosyltransferase family 4 protein [Desulfitobacterium hafniense]
MKKALFIAYYYPPYGGGGVQRTTKYVKYLRHYGWEPVVLSIDEDKIPLIDKSLLKDVPEQQEIIRTNIWALTTFERFLKTRSAKVKKQADGIGNSQQDSGANHNHETSANSNHGSSFKIGKSIKASVRQILKQVFLFAYTFVLFPDDKIGWYPFALRKAKDRVLEGDIDLIYTTSAPFTAHLIGLGLKKATGKPWVADFRDPWAGNRYLNFASFRKPLDRLVEGLCVAQADKVITVSDPIREDFLRNYPKEPKDKFLVILNGYDEEDLKIIEELKLEDHTTSDRSRLTFSYTGSFYNEISPRCFLGAMEELLTHSKLPKEDIRVHFTGQFGSESLQLINSFRNKYPEVMEISGYVPHLEATRKMLTADVLLLFLNKGAARGVLTGKIFEYLGSGRPVLGLMPQGLAADLLYEAKAGVVVEPDDHERIKEAILNFYGKWKSGQLISTTDKDVARQYSREVLAGKLAQVFNSTSQKV